MNIQHLQYVTNTNGSATVENFIEDFEPIGRIVWRELKDAKLVKVVYGKIKLTAAGELTLMTLTSATAAPRER